MLFFIFIPVSPLSAQTDTIGRPKIGLIFSGGSAKGLAHIGVLKVLEEAGIRPDYIGGASMGAIVGGLYAIGYSADSLQKIVSSADWPFLLGDEISRRNLTLEEKEDVDRFVISFPIKENKIKIPSGVINGENIEEMLNTLCAPVYNIRDFSRFQIPFMCVATDIETGKEVDFYSGYLPKVIRASMSIPSIFNPIEINNTLLVDGGLVNNFPVARVKDMGADILIGVNVGFQYYKKDQLNSIFRIIEQSVFFYGEKLNRYNMNLCDILVEPDLKGYNSTSFSSADSIIKRGEQAARAFLPQFKALADSLKSLDPAYGPHQQLPDVDSLLLMEIRVRGLDNVSGKLLNGKLQLEVLHKVTPQQIEVAIKRVYSSLYFEKVDYEIEPLERGIRLIIKVKEAKGGQFRVGLHYDTNYKSAILLNTTFRNLLLDGSKLSVSTALGENPFLEASFFKNNGWKPGYGLEFGSRRTNVFAYENGSKTSSYMYSETKTSLYTQSIFNNSYALGAGIQYEASRIKYGINPDPVIPDNTQVYLNYYGFLEMDTYDDGFYPKRGLQMHAEFKLVTQKNMDPVAFFTGRLSQAYRISDHLTYVNHLYGGSVDGTNIPYQYMFYAGGLNPSRWNGLIPFVGLNYMEKTAQNALVLAGDLQLEIFPNIYLIMKGNAGKMENNFNDLFTAARILGGYGLTAGYESFIGPVELSVMKSANRGGLLGFVNIGFWF